MRYIILDGDPGHDDALAWAIANTYEELKIIGVITCAGNQTIEKTTYNALRVIKLFKIDADVVKGLKKPLVNEIMNAPSVHGESGLDGPVIEEPDKTALDVNVIDYYKELILKYKKVTIVATGPLTNVALLISIYPQLKEHIELISLMGGGLCFGNWTPSAEFNILVDPHSAKIVFESGINILMSPLDVTEKSLIFPEDFEILRKHNTKVSIIVSKWLEFFYEFHFQKGYKGAPMHDPCAVMALVHPEIFKMEDYFVEIETKGQYNVGETVCDFFNRKNQKPNVKALVDVDLAMFRKYFIEALKTYE